MSANLTPLMERTQRTLHSATGKHSSSSSEKISASSSTTAASSVAPASLATISLMSTLFLLYYMKGQGKVPKKTKAVTMTMDKLYSNYSHEHLHVIADADGDQRSTPLPGFGIFGDKVNEFVSIFLDALAIYVHNDSKWDCQRRLLCEANQRAVDYGIFHGILMYFTSLSVSFWLRDQKVSQSIEAMRKGRSGQDCTINYPKCPFSL